MKPPLTYFGGKTAIAERVAALLPPHEHYVEPFAGSLAVLLAKPPSAHETVNDLNGDLMNFWRILRDRPADLARACALTPHSRAEMAAAYEPADDQLEQARRLWVRLTQGRSARMITRTGWRFYADPAGSPGTSMPDVLDGYVARIIPAAARLRGVSLECRDALELIRLYGKHPGVLIYADPPYLVTSRVWKGPAYVHEMRDGDDHRRLAEELRKCRAAVVLSGYDDPAYSVLYSDWDRAEITASAANAAGDRRRTEVLWSNRPFPARQATLTDALAEVTP